MTQALLNSPGEIVRAYLLNKTTPAFTLPVIGSQSAWQLYVSELPDGQGAGIPDSCACVDDTAGQLAWRSLSTGKSVFKFGFQIRLRSGNDQLNPFAAAYSLLNSVRDLFDQPGPGAVTINGTRYPIDGFINTSAVLYLGQDIHRRELFSINGQILLAKFT